MTLSATVAIPTHNRAALLAGTLASLGEMVVPGNLELECLVVDNASTDETAQVVKSASARLGFPVRLVLEPRLGSSFARNRAIAEARGEIICFIDDDVIVDSRWLVELIGEMERRGLDAACGMVAPRFLAPPPAWLGTRLWVRLAVHDAAALERKSASEIEIVHNYFSANAGFRRELFARCGRFREDLGVVGANPISGEDTELFERIIKAGGSLGFAARARVYHLVGPERMTRRYLRRKSFAFGIGSGICGSAHNHMDKLARNAIRMGVAAARGDGEAVVYHQLEICNYFGYWRGRLMRRNFRKSLHANSSPPRYL